MDMDADNEFDTNPDDKLGVDQDDTPAVAQQIDSQAT